MYKSKKPYLYGTGRPKSSWPGASVPQRHRRDHHQRRDIDDYFGLETLKLLVRQPLATTDTLGKVDIVATVTGGGVTGQAGAIRHGVAPRSVAGQPRVPRRPQGRRFPHPRSSHEGA